MSEYSYSKLKELAQKSDLWIDVQDAGTPRGRDYGNTNKKERVSRALSWYGRVAETENKDERLIFVCIAFDSLYTQSKESDTDRDGFISKLEQSKYKNVIFDLTKDNIKNIKEINYFQYISSKYWHCDFNDRDMYDKLQEDKRNAKKFTSAQIDKQNFYPIKLAMTRIQLLRNQILHGMAAYNDSYNRKQVELCADFFYLLVGRIIWIIINDNQQSWGKVPYPPQGNPNEAIAEVQELED